MAGTSSEERRDETEKDGVHKTKLVQFLGRTTPIILQNDNGPCPLLAICNVLLLRNNLSLSPETTEVSQEKLLSLVAERLIDSNSNVDNKDAGYVQNQQQNIADAIDLLPRLATGIDVNIKFKRVDDFEFTRECAIFDLLDIPLYHGWIVDPQDQDTTTAIGSKSYNALMGELVVLDTQNTKEEWRNSPEEDSIDFAAATTATLGVPSPSLSRGRSFDGSPHSDLDQQKSRKGDIEEEVELLRVLQLSKANVPNLVEDSVVLNSSEDKVTVCTDEGTCPTKVSSIDPGNMVEGQTDGENMPSHHLESSIFDDYSTSRKDRNDVLSFETFSKETICSSSKTVESNDIDQGTAKSGEGSLCNNIVEEERIDLPSQTGGMHSLLHVEEIVNLVEKSKETVGGEELPDPQSVLGVDIPEPSYSHSASDTTEVSPLCGPSVDSSNGRQLQIHAREVHCSNVDGNEPIYEGEDCTLDSRTTIFVDREPIYEGEVILAEQADNGSIDVTSLNSKEITPREGELIRNFLRNNASQLTICGLFSLQDGLKERELCVFFRNNHFSTMFKFDGELYLLATDQGYITQSDLVWEKLNEVNGDTLFMTGNFKEFKVENHADGTWDEHNALANTADYLASIDHSAQAGSNFNSDLQLAIALQQQEFEQQPQRETQKPPPGSGSSRLVTGPQVPRNSNRTSSVVPPTVAKPNSKEKCTVM